MINDEQKLVRFPSYAQSEAGLLGSQFGWCTDRCLQG